MRAKVIKEFMGAPDHDPRTRTIAVGEIIDGELADVAIREKWAKPYRDDPEIAAEKAAKDAAAKAEAEKSAAKGDDKSANT